MYTSEIGLENFKRFSDVKINLSSKITLLLGPNSSGKSSVMKSLLGLKQTASPANEHEVFSAQGEYVDLGVYRDYVLDHDIGKKIKIGLKVLQNPNPYTKKAPRLLHVIFCYGYDFATEQARLLEILVHEATDSSPPLLHLVKKKTRDSFLLTMSKEFAKEAIVEIFGSNSTDAKKYEKFSSKWVKGMSVVAGDRYQFSIDNTIKNAAKSKNFFEIYPISVLSGLVDSVLRGLDRDFFYLGPLRRSPSRSYSRTAHLLSVGPSGEHTPSVLANLKSRAAKERSKERPHSKRMTQLTNWVESIFPGCRIDAKTVEELVKLEIERDGGAREVISDVGFGFSQVLPILVQAAVMPEETTLLIEQPELHLHPRAQTKLAEVIAEASNSGRRFLIETHSEHFVRGLQLAVSNKSAKKSAVHFRLSAEDIRFIYVPKYPQKPLEIGLDQWGEFTRPWPTGFFDEGYVSALKLMQNKIASEEKRGVENQTPTGSIKTEASAAK